MDSKERSWHKEVIPEAAKQVFVILRKSIGSFYLAGGTALALQLGHRISRDLDFFTPESFDEEKLLSDLKDAQKLSVVSKGREALHLRVRGIKVSFLGYHYPILFPLESFMGIPVADPRDIACMKISAIAGRGSKRDFFDLYVSAKQYGLASLLGLFKEKYAQVDFNLVHALKSLTYFGDAEKEPTPNMLSSISWNKVREFFQQEAPKLI